MKKLYFLLIFLSIFQDLPLANYIGDFGRSIVGIFSILVLLFTLIKYKKIQYNKTITVLVALAIYLLVYNLILFAGYVFLGKDLIILGENVFDKMIKVYSYYLTNILYFISLYQIGKNLDNKSMLKPFYITYFLIFILMVIEYFQLPSAFSFLHATRPLDYNRIRLLTNESSNTTTIILVFFTLAFQYAINYESKIKQFIIVLFLLLFIYTTTSKTLFITLGFSGLIMIFFSNKVKFKYKFSILLVGIVSILFLSQNVMKYFGLVSSSTTMYTRGYTYIISLFISIRYPFGVGNTLYLKVFTDTLKEYLPIANNLIRNFNSSELNYILNSGTDLNVSAYSGIMQYGIYWGIIGNLIFTRSIWKSIKNNVKQYPILSFGFISILLSVLTTISLDNKYEIWAFIFILMVFNKREDNVNEKSNNDI